MKNWKNTLRVLGIVTCLVSAFLMAFGEPIVGTNHAGIATVVAITGIGIITTANKISFSGKKKEGK